MKLFTVLVLSIGQSRVYTYAINYRKALPMNTEMCGKCGYEKQAIDGKIEFPHKDYAVFICNDCKGE